MNQNYIVQSYLNKQKYNRIYITFGVLIALSAIGVIWAYFNWDDYSTTTENILTGRVRERGWAPTIFGWGLGLIGCLLFVFLIMWRTLDFKNPSVAISNEGVLLNKEFFKNNFVQWDDFSSIKKSSKNETETIELQFKSPEEIVNRQSGMGKAFLKQSYIKEPGTFSIDKNDDPEVYQALLNHLK